jgi:MFS family permease
MRFVNTLQPSPSLSEDQLKRGIRAFTIEGTATMGLGSITGSGLLAAYAIALGANNTQIGLLAALPFLFMPLQLFTVVLVEKIRRRKLIAVPLWIVAQFFWIPIALIPGMMEAPSGIAVSALLILMGFRSAAVAMQNAAWNSWLRDLIPAEQMGAIFANRLKYASIASMGFGLGAALFVDYWRDSRGADQELVGYTMALLTGAILLGGVSEIYRAMIPEPRMVEPVGERVSIVKTLVEPFRDSAYRPLMVFMFLWNLALHLSIPFFAVYMLQRIGLPVSAVLGFAVISQIFNVMFLRFWGPMVDKVGNKAVLGVSASLYLFVILGWTFTTLPERHAMTIPIVILLHVLAGAAAAGANVSTGAFPMKLAPPQKATAYVAALSVLANIGAGIGPLAGGILADFFSTRELSINLNWSDPTREFELAAISLSSLDFLFVISFLVGLLTLNVLASVREQGEESSEVVLNALYAHAQRATAPMSSVPGFGLLTQYPFGYMRRVPGLDVAAGVTAYQVAETTRMAASAVSRTGHSLSNLTHEVRRSMEDVLKRGSEFEHHMVELGRHAVKGAVDALVAAGALSPETIAASMSGAMEVMISDGGASTRDSLLAAGIGAVDSVSDEPESSVEMVQATVDALTQVATDFDIDETIVDEVVQEVEDRTKEFTREVSESESTA